MTRLIDADALIEAMTKFSNATGEDMTHGIFYAHIAPTIDAVPVIRCKDCKHRDPEDKKCDCGHSIRWNLPRSDEWFCADAERKETS